MQLCLFLARQPPVGQGPLIHDVARSHTTTHRSRQDFSGRVISSSQRPLPDNAQHSQQTNIHASDGIRTHNLNRRAAADLRLRLRSLWDRHKCSSCIQKNNPCPLQEVKEIDASRKKNVGFLCLVSKPKALRLTSLPQSALDDVR